MYLGGSKFSEASEEASTLERFELSRCLAANLLSAAVQQNSFINLIELSARNGDFSTKMADFLTKNADFSTKTTDFPSQSTDILAKLTDFSTKCSDFSSPLEWIRKQQLSSVRSNV
jgi:hypothetical protein